MSGLARAAKTSKRPTPNVGSSESISAAESPLEESLAELSELGELWLERHVLHQDNVQVSRAMRQAESDSRRLERKARR